LQALLNGNSIPSQVDANHLRSRFAGQLESTTSSELAKPSSEAVSPGMPPISRRASFEHSHSDAHNLGLLDDPGEHDVASPPLSHLQEFAKSLEETKVNLKEYIKALEKQKGQLAKMSQERHLFQQKLTNGKKLADELTGKVEKSEADYRAACEWFNQCITGCKVEPANTLLSKIISDAKSTIQSSAAEINSHKEILESMQAKCDEYKDTIEKLQAEILSSTKQGDVIEKNIRRNRESLAHVNQEFAKIAVSLGFTECR
jgi:myosin heavy subunit